MAFFLYNCSNVVVNWICDLGSNSVTASFHGSSVLVENFVLSNPPPSASISRRIQSKFCSYICGNSNDAWSEMRRLRDTARRLLLPLNSNVRLSSLRSSLLFSQLRLKRSWKIKWEECQVRTCVNTELFKMIVGVLTTCHTQYTWDRSICIFYLIEQHSKFLLHTLQVLYICTLCDSTNTNTVIEFVPNWKVVKTPTVFSNNPVYKQWRCVIAKWPLRRRSVQESGVNSFVISV